MAAAMEAAMKITKLGEDNYLTWFADIEQLLKVRDCWDAVTCDPPAAIAAVLAAEGTIPSKADLTLTLSAAETTVDDKTMVRAQLRALEWRRKDEVAKALMHLNVKPIHHATFRMTATARSAWQELQQAFRSMGIARATDMRRQITALRKEAGEGVTEYINRGTMLRYEMKLMDQEPKEIELVAALLAGLPSEYDNTVEVMQMLKLTTLNDIKEQLVVAEVTHKRKARTNEREAAALAAAAAAAAPKPLPPAQRHYENDGRYIDRRQCYGCGDYGHIRRDCRTNPYWRPRDNDRYHDAHQRHGSPPRQYGQDDRDRAGGWRQHRPNSPPPRRNPHGGGDADPPAGGLAMMATGTAAVVTSIERPKQDPDWIIDSGASHHMTGQEKTLTNLREVEPVKITIADGRNTTAVMAGDAVLPMITDAGMRSTVLKDVLLAPGLTVNLFSIKAIMQRGFGAHFSSGSVIIINEDKVVFRGRAQGHVFVLPTTRPIPEYVGGAGLAAASVGVKRWHNRLAHPGKEATLRTQRMVDGMHITEASPRKALEPLCEPCVFGKQTRGPFPTSQTKTTAAMDLIHLDICGPMPVASTGGSKFLLGAIDDTSAYAAAIPLPTKAHAGGAAALLLKDWEREAGKPAAMLRSDRGGEFINHAVASWTREEGMVHQTTAPYTPQQNGKAERFNRSLMEKVTAVMIASKCDPSLWAEAAATVTYAMNRTAKAGKTMTPFELWCGKRPSIAHMRTFGCAAYVLTPAKFRRKLDPRGRKGIFLGYEPHSKAYRTWVGGKIVISRDVVFDESFMGDDNHEPADAASYDWAGVEDSWGALSSDGDEQGGADAVATDVPEPETNNDEGDQPATPPGDATDKDTTADDAEMTTIIEAARRASGLDVTPPGSSSGESTTNAADSPPAAARYPSRVRAQPARLGEGDAHPAVAQELDDTDEVPIWTGAALAARAVLPNPDKMTLAQARLEPDWDQFDLSTTKEVNSLWDNGTFELVKPPPMGPLPPLLPVQILCNRKRGDVGQIVKWKSRGVARGDLQVKGRDYTDVWAPVVRKATLLAMLALAAAERLLLYQLDVETAFLNGPVEEELYVRQPKGYERGDPTMLCRLRKAIYGLKQAARQWYLELVKLMTTMGMTQSDADPCLFYNIGTSHGRTFIIVYVDDILILAKRQEDIDAMKQMVMRAFKSTDVGPPTFFLGLHIKCDPERQTITVSQQQYVRTLLARSGMENANRVCLPMTVGAQLQKAGTPLDGPGREDYQTLIGGLLYLASCTRPDISFTVGKLARYGAAPTVAHQAAAKTVLRYLSGTATWGLQYGTRSPLVGYTDADYAGDTDTRRSTTGYAFMMNGAAISWQSKVQPTVATSTTEAEYIATAQGAREGVWLKLLLKDLTGTDEAVTLRCDNQSAIKLIDNPAGTARSKHIDVAHHFVRDRAARGDLSIEYVPTTSMTADVLTKALPSMLLANCMKGLGMVNVDPLGGLKGSVERDEDAKSTPGKSPPRCDSTLTPQGGMGNSTTSPPDEGTVTRRLGAKRADQLAGGEITGGTDRGGGGQTETDGRHLAGDEGVGGSDDDGGRPAGASGTPSGEPGGAATTS